MATTSQIALFRALPAYLGGKRKLVPLILGLLGRHLPRGRWVGSSLLDPMSGGGAMALAAKAYGFRVTASDVSERSAVTSRALIANPRRRLARDDMVRLLNSVPAGPPGTMPFDRFDLLFRGALSRPEPVSSLLTLTLIKAYLRSFPMSMPSASDAVHFDRGDLDEISPRRLGQYLRRDRLFGLGQLWRIAQDVNVGVAGGEGQADRGDALEVMNDSPADVVYLDPPYPGTTGYDRVYRDLDVLLGDTGVRPPSPSLGELLAASKHIPWLVLSYGGPGVELVELVDTVSRYRDPVESLRIPYRHLSPIATEERNNSSAEFIVIARR